MNSLLTDFRNSWFLPSNDRGRIVSEAQSMYEACPRFPNCRLCLLGGHQMSTVHEATCEVLRSLGMTTIFGNPGSNELPFLDRLPSDFRYILALQECAGLAIADAYSQATGRPVLVNLHAAAGLGMAMGSLVNAQIQGTPLLIMSGQQSRAMLTLEAQLSIRDA